MKENKSNKEWEGKTLASTSKRKFLTSFCIFEEMSTSLLMKQTIIDILRYACSSEEY
jgi:hypothetical protein